MQGGSRLLHLLLGRHTEGRRLGGVCRGFFAAVGGDLGGSAGLTGGVALGGLAVSGGLFRRERCPGDGEKETFVLNSPNYGLYIPKKCWRTMKYTHNAVQMCIASNEYDEKDYIREYQLFLNEKKLYP